MNPVYIRMVIYFIAPIMAMVPGVTYDASAQAVILDLNTIAIGIAGSAAFTGAVFAKWGNKS